MSHSFCQCRLSIKYQIPNNIAVIVTSTYWDTTMSLPCHYHVTIMSLWCHCDVIIVSLSCHCHIAVMSLSYNVTMAQFCFLTKLSRKIFFLNQCAFKSTILLIKSFNFLIFKSYRLFIVSMLVFSCFNVALNGILVNYV